MATFGIDVDEEIIGGRAYVPSHILRVYRTLGPSSREEINDRIDFTGSAAFGRENVIEFGVLGDVNMDGVVTADDAQLIQEFVVGIESLTPEQLERADVNGDGEVTSSDAALVLQYVNGLINSFPAGDPAPTQDDLDQFDDEDLDPPKFAIGASNTSVINNTYALGLESKPWRRNQFALSSSSDLIGSQESRFILTQFTENVDRVKFFYIPTPPEHEGFVRANVKITGGRSKAWNTNGNDVPPVAAWEWDIIAFANNVDILNERILFPNSSEYTNSQSISDYFDVLFIPNNGDFSIRIEDNSWDTSFFGVTNDPSKWTCDITFTEVFNGVPSLSHDISYVPNGGAIQQGATITISGSASGGNGAYTHTIERSIDGGITWNALQTEFGSSFSETVSSVSEFNTDQEQYRVITQSDGQQVTTTSNVFTGANNPPLTQNVTFNPNSGIISGSGDTVEINVSSSGASGSGTYEHRVSESTDGGNTWQLLLLSIDDSFTDTFLPSVTFSGETSQFRVVTIADDGQQEQAISGIYEGTGFPQLVQNVTFDPDGGNVSTGTSNVNVNVNLSGGDGTYTTEIQRNVNNTTWNTIVTNTSSSFSQNVTTGGIDTANDSYQLRVVTTTGDSQNETTTSNMYTGVSIPEISGIDTSDIVLNASGGAVDSESRSFQNIGEIASVLSGNILLTQDANGWLSLNNGGSFSVNKGDSKNFTVNFGPPPSASGSSNGQIAISHNDPNVPSPIEIDVTGVVFGSGGGSGSGGSGGGSGSGGGGNGGNTFQ